MISTKKVDIGKLLTDVTTIANDVKSAETDCKVSVADKLTKRKINLGNI